MNYSHYEPHGYFIEYIFDNYIKITIKFMVRTTDGFESLFVEKSNVKLVHDINNNLSVIVNYSM
jgi:hypothetical protein